MRSVSSTLRFRLLMPAVSLALALAVASAASAQEAQAQQQPQQQQATGLTFGTDAGIVFNVIKPDKTADFEVVMEKLKEALGKIDNPVRKQQASGWKVFKVQEPGPNGNVFYLFVVDPVVKDADYTVAKILYEAFPTEAQDLYNKMRDCYAGGGSKLSLQSIQKFGQ